MIYWTNVDSLQRTSIVVTMQPSFIITQAFLHRHTVCIYIVELA